MKAGEFFKQTDAFINEICQPFIAVNGDWLSIEVKRKGTDGESYIRMVDAAYDSYYYDVTAMSVEQIGVLVANIISGNKEKQITSYENRKEIAKLFRN